MIITVINMSKDIADEELHPVIRAINRQIAEDFQPYWSLGATLRLEGRTGDAQQPDKVHLTEMRGDALLYLWDRADVAGALGYHARNFQGMPFGFVFTEVAKKSGESWTVTLSHEALELVADPLVNLLVAGPHPQENRVVFHWYEMSDAVQGETYQIDGVELSNFVLPLYFTPDAEKGSRNDFLGKQHKGVTLPSFGVNPGGYIGFYDPQLQQDVTFALRGDAAAKKRLDAKRLNSASRRSHRSLSCAADWGKEEKLQHSTGRARGSATAARSEQRYERID